MAALTVIETNGELAIGIYGRCLLVVWRAQPTDATMGRRNVILREICAKFPGNCALVEVIEPSSKPPNESTRKVAMDTIRDLGPKLTAIAFALEGDQIRVALNRTILTTMLFFLKQPQPTKAFRTIREALTWTAARISEGADFVTGAEASLESLRDLIGATQPSLTV